MTTTLGKKLLIHQQTALACRRCPQMQSTPVLGPPVVSPVLLVGQAPGVREPQLGRPFAWTAGKQLFSWFATIGPSEKEFRSKVYMAAVCRCFPGKAESGGDRVPNPKEIENCSHWLHRELDLLRPRLIVPIGRLAIEQFLPPGPLVETIGKIHSQKFGKFSRDILPLPHPSGASTWYKRDPGNGLLLAALQLLKQHAAWQELFTTDM